MRPRGSTPSGTWRGCRGSAFSYTTFAYSSLVLSGPIGGSTVTVAFDVTNTGSRTGEEVPQIYVGFPSAAGEPPRQLAGFEKVTLAPDQKKRVSVILERRTFSTWDTSSQSWIVPGGAHSIKVGASSRDIRLSGTAFVTAAGPRAGAIRGIAEQCIDVDGAQTANGTAVQLYACNGTGAQRWIVADDGSLRALGKCFDVTNGSFTPGQPIQLYDCNDTDAQRWRVDTTGAIVNIASGLCVDTRGGGSSERTRLVIHTCSAAPSQRWVLP
ncbi:ricin-type beta-trefoil lectin domain protein [Pendulispora albinea]|uniref:Ricin-type beta-trefoil lectin domain protein n=1 Tax=Pendulispora albinea TaxID=2741071 RepID=A0ABZ2M5B1_9BACT